MKPNILTRVAAYFGFEPASKPVAATQRPDLARLAAAFNRHQSIRATYDAARDGDLENYWANADTYDADSANSKDVRQKLVSRSRYEIANNGYSDGIAQTKANHLVGSCGPQLRMQTGSEGFNRMVENAWHLWAKAIQFRRKLWCMAHAFHGDGEGIAVMRRNPRVRFPIALDVVQYETEQCQTPYLPFGEKGRIDGIRFDEFGNATVYEILHEHPGSSRRFDIDLTPEQVPAEKVLHWFKLRRPGQHRGIPGNTSTLNVGASARRYREANLATAEKVANFTLFLKTIFQPDALDQVDPMSELEMQKGMMTALPNNVEPVQLKAEHPSANYAEFIRTLINEQARAANMPYNVAACDSSSYNYASGRLDHQTYYTSLDIDREDCNDLVLDPLFATWFDLAIVRFGWLGGNPDAVGPAARAHLWDWPKHRVADVEAEANAIQTRLKSGQVFPHQVFADAGVDLEDEIEKAAITFGKSAAEIRSRLFDVLLPPPKQEAQTEPGTLTDKAMAASILNRAGLNGHAHGAKVNGN